MIEKVSDYAPVEATVSDEMVDLEPFRIETRYRQDQEALFQAAEAYYNDGYIRERVEAYNTQWNFKIDTDKVCQLAAIESEIPEGVDSAVVEWIQTSRNKLNELYLAKTSYEMRAGHIDAASDYARRLTHYSAKIAVFTEAMQQGELTVAMSMGDLRAEAEADDNPEPLTRYLLAELTLGWNIDLNCEAIHTMLGERGFGYRTKEALALQAGRVLADRGRYDEARTVVNRASDHGDSSRIIDAYIEQARAQTGAIEDRELKAYRTRLKRHKKQTAPEGDNLIDAVIILDIIEPSKATEGVLGLINRKSSRLNPAHKEYLLQRFFREYHLAEQTAVSVRRNLEHGFSDVAKDIYQQTSVEAFKSANPDHLIELMKMAMELDLAGVDATGDKQEQIATECIAELELIRSTYVAEVPHVMQDRVDQARFRQRYNDKLHGVFLHVVEQTDPVMLFNILSELMTMQREYDGQSIHLRDYKEALTVAAKTCLESPIARLSLSEEKIRQTAKTFGVQLES